MIADQQTAELNTLVNALVTAGQAPGEDELAKMAMTLSKAFKVDPDEVAILALNARNKNLSFVIPQKLASVGSIPLTSNSALAARTARERRPEISNNFSSSRHATVFEGVPLGRNQSELIQKIMSAPILDGTHVVGVLQVSRKGRSPATSGPDFTPKDLQSLTAFSPTLARFLKLFHPA